MDNIRDIFEDNNINMDGVIDSEQLIDFDMDEIDQSSKNDADSSLILYNSGFRTQYQALLVLQ